MGTKTNYYESSPGLVMISLRAAAKPRVQSEHGFYANSTTLSLIEVCVEAANWTLKMSNPIWPDYELKD